ncbi:MAG: type II secretion system protein [Planctomycetota bacterium]
MKPLSRRARSGFTLIEAAITIAIVGLAVTYTLQALTSAQTTAAYSHDLKLAREMGLRTLGQAATGQFEHEYGQLLTGNYPEDEAPRMSYQMVFGDTQLPPHGDDVDRNRERVDNWANRRDWEERQGNTTGDEEEHGEYETVKIRVLFPKHSTELPDSIELEAWLPWTQVYPQDLEEVTQEDPTTSTTGDNTGEGDDTSQDR